MADAQAPVADKVAQPSVLGAPSTGDNAPPKDLGDSLGVKPTEEKPAEPAPAPVAADSIPSKLEAPAAEAAPFAPTDAQSKPAEETSEPVKLTEPATETAPVQPSNGTEPNSVPEVPNALQTELKAPAPEPAEPVKAPAAPEPAKEEPIKESVLPSEPAPAPVPAPVEEKPVETKAETKPETTTTATILNGGSKDVEMQDAPAPAPAPATAPVESVKPPVSDTAEKPSIAAAAEPPAPEKRKAETNGDEPSGKKQKTGGITDKISSAVESAKEKVTKATNGPSRKDSRKKKEPAAIGKTLRKTRSQGPVES